MSNTCIHQDEDDTEPCGKPAKDEYGGRYCGIHKASYYMELMQEHQSARKALESRLAQIATNHAVELERMKGYTSKESKISTALLWVGSLSAAAFAGALATYLIL